jgi:hypothetical protein
MLPFFKPGDNCPVCGEVCDDQSEYVDVGPGYVQVTYDMYCISCGAEGHNTATEVEWYVPDPFSPSGMSRLDKKQ